MIAIRGQFTYQSVTRRDDHAKDDDALWIVIILWRWVKDEEEKEMRKVRRRLLRGGYNLRVTTAAAATIGKWSISTSSLFCGISYCFVIIDECS